jgi:hypothetical protein
MSVRTLRVRNCSSCLDSSGHLSNNLCNQLLDNFKFEIKLYHCEESSLNPRCPSEAQPTDGQAFAKAFGSESKRDENEVNDIGEFEDA